MRRRYNIYAFADIVGILKWRKLNTARIGKQETLTEIWRENLLENDRPPGTWNYDIKVVCF